MTDECNAIPRPRDDERDLSAVHGTVLHREKVISRALAGMMAGGALLFLLAGVAAVFGERGAPWWALAFPFVISLLFSMVALIKPVLRTTVTDEEVYALHGLRETRVSMTAIDAVTVVEGTRQALLGAESIGPAVTGRVVLISWTDADGVAKKCAIASNDPEQLAGAINGVRSARASRLSSLRVDVYEEHEHEVAAAAPTDGRGAVADR